MSPSLNGRMRWENVHGMGLHRALNVEPDRLREVFRLRDQRHVGANLTLSYANKRVMLEVNEISRGLVGRYVDVCEFADGRLQVQADGLALPHTVFEKNQRVTHAAVTGKKHLGAVLAWIKAEQEKTPPKVKTKRTSARNAYRKTGRRSPGRPSMVDAIAERRRAEKALEDARADGQASDP